MSEFESKKHPAEKAIQLAMINESLWGDSNCLQNGGHPKLLPAIIRLNKALAAGSQTARDHLRGFINEVIDNYPDEWLETLIVGVEGFQKINKSVALLGELQILYRNFRLREYDAIRGVLKDLLITEGDQFLALLCDGTARLIDNGGIATGSQQK